MSRAAKDLSRAAQDLLKSFDHLTPDERAKVIEVLERREDRYWNERADRSAAEGGAPVPASEVRRVIESDRIL